MNLLTLCDFLMVTSVIGALVGSGIGFYTVGTGKGAALGVVAGPVVAFGIVSIVSFIGEGMRNRK